METGRRRPMIFDKPSLGRTEAHIENVAAAVDKAFPMRPKRG